VLIWLFVASASSRLIVWNLETNTQVLERQPPLQKAFLRKCSGVQALRDGLLATSFEKDILFWDIRQDSALPVRSIASNCRVNALEEVDNNMLAAGCNGLAIRLYDLRMNKERAPEVLKMAGHTGWVSSLQRFEAARGKFFLASASWDHTIRLWDWHEGKCVSVKHGVHSDVVSGLARGPSGLFGAGTEALVSGSWDQTVSVLWDPLLFHTWQENDPSSAGGHPIQKSSEQRSLSH
jgi:WD40 repeat protein